MEPKPHNAHCLKISGFKDLVIKRQAGLLSPKDLNNKNKSVFSLLINHQKCYANNFDQAEREVKSDWKENISIMEGREGIANSVWDKFTCTGLYS